jgi:hypothetical protein
VGPLDGKWRLPVGKVGEWYVESWQLQGCSPRLSQLRADGLAPVSKYWTYQSHVDVYGPSKPSSQMSTEAWLFPLLQWLVQERSWVQTRGSLSRAEGCVGSPSSRVQRIYSNLLITMWKVAICGPHEIRMILDHTRTERGKRVAYWSGFLLQGVHRFELPWLSDMSNSSFMAVIK